jgi:hypothetical protein
MSKVVNLRDLQILPIDDTDVHVIEWCPGDNAVNPPEQVHVLIRLPFGKMGFTIRLKTRAAADRFIAALRKHADAVWPVT